VQGPLLGPPSLELQSILGGLQQAGRYSIPPKPKPVPGAARDAAPKAGAEAAPKAGADCAPKFGIPPNAGPEPKAAPNVGADPEAAPNAGADPEAAPNAGADPAPKVGAEAAPNAGVEEPPKRFKPPPKAGADSALPCIALPKAPAGCSAPDDALAPNNIPEAEKAISDAGCARVAAISFCAGIHNTRCPPVGPESML